MERTILDASGWQYAFVHSFAQHERLLNCPAHATKRDCQVQRPALGATDTGCIGLSLSSHAALHTIMRLVASILTWKFNYAVQCTEPPLFRLGYGLSQTTRQTKRQMQQNRCHAVYKRIV
ncbi:hypothetical protein ABBQ32_009849 [Trebouxia sp. C0010 RCD-2024]